MSTPRVAVVIPCFNLGSFVSTAVWSALQQEIDAEIVVIDDGSTDSDTQRELDELRARGITVVRTENRGLAAARNLGISSTSAPFLCMLDADDVLAPGYFKAAVDLLNEDADLAFVSCWLQAFGERNWLWRQDSCALPDLLDECTVCTAAIVRRSAIEAIGGFDEAMPIPGYEDWDLWISLVERGYRGTILQDVFFFYRQRPNSMSETCCAPDGHARLSRYLIEKHWKSFDRHMSDLIGLKIHREGDLLKKTAALEVLSAVAVMPAPLPADPAQPAATFDEAAALRASLSWRITAPLRAAYDLAREPLAFFRNRRSGVQTEQHSAAIEDVGHKHRDAVTTPGPDVLIDKDLARMEQEAHLQQLRRTRPTPRVAPVILMYHRVGEIVFDPFGLAISPARFEAHMRHLHRHCCPMSLSDLRLAICQNAVPEGAVAVTIDDGYVDSLTEASPVLLRHRVPATFFVTAAAESEGFWWDALSSAITAHPEGQCLKWIDGTEVGAESRESLAGWLRDQLVPLTRTERDRATEFLRRQFQDRPGLDPGLDRDRRLTPREVKLLFERPGHTIGSHTVNHLSLPDLNPADRDLEIQIGRTTLERLTGAPVRALAYPFGRTDGPTVQAAIDAGIVLGVTTEPRPLRSDDSPWLLPRVDACRLKDFEKDLPRLFASQP